jgi:ferrous-iron efflux pump FieF
MKRATWASVAVAGTLIVAKLLAWLATDSMSVLSTLIDSMLDAAASIVNLIAVRHALMPADREHRFGHGKAEPLAALAQSAFIAGSACLLIIEAGRRLYEPVPVSNTTVGIAVMVLAIVLTAVLVGFQHYVVKRTGSFAIKADSLHYKGDVLVNASVIVSLVLAERLGWPYADPLFGAAIAVYILVSAGAIAKGSLDMLMDREMPEADRRRIRELALEHPEVLDMHDLKTRVAGPYAFIQLHLEMDGAMTLEHAHRIADEVEAEIVTAFPGADVIIHEDPAGVPESRQEFA